MDPSQFLLGWEESSADWRKKYKEQKLTFHNMFSCFPWLEKNRETNRQTGLDTQAIQFSFNPDGNTLCSFPKAFRPEGRYKSVFAQGREKLYIANQIQSRLCIFST